jgi:hypothetical protein
VFQISETCPIRFSRDFQQKLDVIVTNAIKMQVELFRRFNDRRSTDNQTTAGDGGCFIHAIARYW